MLVFVGNKDEYGNYDVIIRGGEFEDRNMLE